ncbi:UDP-N-acetylmuramate--L-alanine ligase [PVC group bacterium (ex Bugula neritina AB1)]|nr:UDP-N-acetylmuramate--L-alanine ligase [PVC group bacterium (ex Bugula neritina AB1)]
MLNTYKNIHFVGIGGIGMSGLAAILLQRGYCVTGSDLLLTHITDRLESLGAKVFQGHTHAHVDRNIDLLVYSTAISFENPEYLEAKKRGISVLSRGELLAQLARLKSSLVAVSGSHGKTTTTAMMADILSFSNKEPAVLVGGVMRRHGTCSYWGDGGIFLAEADEHDGSFLNMMPTIAILTNIDFEHMKNYGNIDALKLAFLNFLKKIPFYGFSVICMDCDQLKSLKPFLSKNHLTYGLDEESDLYAKNISYSESLDNSWTSFKVYNTKKTLGKEGEWGEVTLKTLGRHNVLNALATITAGVALGLSFESCAKALSTFDGVDLRMDIFTRNDGGYLIQDYAHHPTEMKAVLNSVLPPKKGKRVLLFQPHLYSRTKLLQSEFVQEMMPVEHVILLPVYAARETPMEGVETEALFQSMKALGHKNVLFFKDECSIFIHLYSILEKEDILFVLGAGNVHDMARKLREKKETFQNVSDSLMPL